MPLSLERRVSKPGHILIVDDDEAIRGFAQLVLEDKGYTTSWSPPMAIRR